MSIGRTVRVHNCFRQDLNEARPKVCNCKKLITPRVADADIDAGIAERVLDYNHMIECPECNGKPVTRCIECGGTGRNKLNKAVPCKSCAKEMYYQNPCSRCGGCGEVPTQAWDIVMVVRAMKTPRVMTIEKANIERAYGIGRGGDEEEAARIEAWDELTQEIRFELLTYYWPKPYDPFEGRPIISTIEGDQRSFRMGNQFPIQ